VFLIVLKDVEVLRREMHRSAWDRMAFIVRYAWCDTRCGPASQWWPRGQTITVGVHPFNGGVVRDTNPKDGMIGKKVVYNGRVDAAMGICDPLRLTPFAGGTFKRTCRRDSSLDARVSVSSDS